MILCGNCQSIIEKQQAEIYGKRIRVNRIVVPVQFGIFFHFVLAITVDIFLNTYILLTKLEGRTGRISARGLDSTDRAQRGPYKKDQGPIFSQYGPEQVWLIRDLLYD